MQEKRIYLDLETTGLDVGRCEVIEGYFKTHDDEYLFQSQVDKWSSEAAKIHKIKKSTMLEFPEKKQAWRDLCKWLMTKKGYQPVLYANPNSVGNNNHRIFHHYDLAVIKMQLLYLSGDHTFFYRVLKDDPTSVHTLAKESVRNGLFKPERKKTKRGMTQDLSQEAVYRALFKKKYKAHRAKDDVLAMIEIHAKLLELNRTRGGLI